MGRYDADAPPGPEWLDLDEDDRIAAVKAHHRGRVLRMHAADMNPQLHATLHVMVENQVAADDPPAAARAVARLCALGLRRHAAIHAIADVAMQRLAATLDAGTFDVAAYEAELDRIDGAAWLALQMRRDLR